jgi:hypothetical protein
MYALGQKASRPAIFFEGPDRMAATVPFLDRLLRDDPWFTGLQSCEPNL